ncbi:MAG: Crp/Fnr family transcriptional regulator [Elusimicrobia bacterium]|nr:Crp/Fnr family transcriptional regulator [Elusimicrobiota bacterium]
MIKKALLKKIPFFKRIKDIHLENFLKYCSLKRYKKREIIFREQTLGKNIYFVIKGKIRIFKKTRAGAIKVLSYLSEGEPFGEMFLFLKGKRTASAQALLDSEVLIVNGNAFQRFISKNVDILCHIIFTLAQRLRKADEEIKSLAYSSVLMRFVFFILDMSERFGKREGRYTVIDFPPITHKEIAQNIGTSREVVSRSINTLEKLGYVKYESGKIKILKKDKLRRFLL